MKTAAGFQKSYSMWQKRLKNHVLCLSDHVFTLLVHPSVSSPFEDRPAFYFYWKRFRHLLADATATTLGLLHTLNILSELRLGGVRRENRVFFPSRRLFLFVDFSSTNTPCFQTKEGGAYETHFPIGEWCLIEFVLLPFGSEGTETCGGRTPT